MPSRPKPVAAAAAEVAAVVVVAATAARVASLPYTHTFPPFHSLSLTFPDTFTTLDGFLGTLDDSWRWCGCTYVSVGVVGGLGREKDFPSPPLPVDQRSEGSSSNHAHRKRNPTPSTLDHTHPLPYYIVRRPYATIRTIHFAPQTTHGTSFSGVTGVDK
ncbi:hypothetical protein E2C01_091276 [Portunus trituberculatus]|uniref:Uncharacterized protein n=1 Tax=Portunus trituberculatus TaxID=210409 RepID=A0A5B7JH38_PORTR|nr:hypothetical protein [Portunus trituberculatus]